MAVSTTPLSTASGVATVVLVVAMVVAGAPVQGWADEEDDPPRREMPLDDPDDQDREDDEDDRLRQPGELGEDREAGRQSLEEMSREQLQEQGFVFENTLTQRERAHATLFALTAGAIVPGAGHWHLDDSSTAATLMVVDAAALTLIGSAFFLSVRPRGRSKLDDRRYDLGYLGAGLLGTSWLIDIFGTAYRDELGIPTSTRRHHGVGVAMGYQYWRPAGLSMRHVADVEVTARGRHIELKGRTAQELGIGMSDYELTGRWFPFVGTTPETRAGFGLSGRYRSYRFDESFRRAEVGGRLRGSLNLGRLVGHLDQMTLGASTGLVLRTASQGRGSVREGSSRWFVPAELFLGLNLTDQLRVRGRWERSTDHWLETFDRLGPVGVGTCEVSYRSTDRLDLQFFTSFGHGVGIGAGLRGWFTE